MPNKSAGSKRKTRDSSRLSDHHQRGKKLSPPLMEVNPSLHSWSDDRLPEMLWAALLVTRLEREKALEVFRDVARIILDWKDTDPPHLITHSALAKLEPEVFQRFLQAIVQDEECRIALVPLLLFRNLPGYDNWATMINIHPSINEWNNLAYSISKTLYHQSQEATDCRWIRLLCVIFARKMSVPSEMLDEYANYPDFGDLRKVRSSIRAAEGALSFLEPDSSSWSEDFWITCLESTACLPFPSDVAFTITRGTNLEQVRKVYDLLLAHNFSTLKTTAVNARHDTVFGIAFYCLTILQELLRIGASQTISARLALRTLVECLIHLQYLALKDDDALWKSYRVFGAGQAKLQYLKLNELDQETHYVDAETLQDLANEDIWEEFVEIKLGHWTNTDLRKLSIEANLKDIYDRFYGWTSSFSHGHWGSVREVVYDICGNPLHRLHRIPRPSPRVLPDVIPDACELIDALLDIVSTCYPEFSERVTIT